MHSREWKVREATTADTGELIRLAGVMLDDVGMDGADPRWRTASEVMLTARLGVDVRGVVAEAAEAEGPGIIGQAMGITVQRLPDPHNLSGRTGYILWAVTEREWRRRGVASELLQEITQSFNRDGIHDLELHASPEGRGLYEKSGFEIGPYPGMRRSSQ